MNSITFEKHQALQSLSKSLGIALTGWLQGLDSMGTDECQLKLLSIMVAMKKVEAISVEEAKAITKAMIRHAGTKHNLLDLFDDAFFDGDLFTLEGGTAALPLEEMRQYVRALKITKPGKYNMVLAKPGCSYMKVEMPVYVPDPETAWLMRSRKAFANAKLHMQPRPSFEFKHMSEPQEQYPDDLELDWVSEHSEEDWEVVGKKGKHK